MRFRRILLILTMVFVPLAHSEEVDTELLLRCISAVETGGNIKVIGASGERSQYQFMPNTWIMYSNVPFRNISLEKYQPEVNRVAHWHIEMIKTSLVQKGKEITPYNIALEWNGGMDRLKYQPRHRDYAKRVNNLYSSGPASI